MDIQQVPTLSLILLLLPLAGFAIQLVAGRKKVMVDPVVDLHRRPGVEHGDSEDATSTWSEHDQRRAVGLSRISTAIIAASLLLSLWIAAAVRGTSSSAERPGYYPKGELARVWFDFADGVMGIGGAHTTVTLGILADDLTAIMLVVVTLISLLVHLFSGRSMHAPSEHDGHLHRYYALLALFTFSMLGVVISGDLLLLYIFWELVGVSASLLIGFRHERSASQHAAIRSFITTVIGDVAMFAGILVLFTQFGTVRFAAIFDQIAAGHLPLGSEGWLTAAGILLFGGAAAKSAQFPFNLWLSDAVEGPAPAAALICAVMTALGVYLLARIVPLLTGDAMLVIAVVGGITALLGASAALVEWDLKRVLASSAVSQLGVMVLALGVGAYSAAIFHMVTHAIFMAGLFLASESVIHRMRGAIERLDDRAIDPQDMRNMGGLRRAMPRTYVAMLVCTLAISGVPLFSGYLSRSAILTGTVAFASLQGGALGTILCAAVYLVAGMTAFSMFRLLFLTFHGRPRASRVHELMGESPRAMTVPLFVLATLSLWLPFGPNPLDPSRGWLLGTAIHIPATVLPTSMQPRLREEPEGTAPSADRVGVGRAGRSTYQGRFEAEVDRLDRTGIPHLLPLSSMAALLVAAIGVFTAYRLHGRDDSARLERVAPQGIRALLANRWYQEELYEKYFPVGLVRLLMKALAWFDQNIVDGIVNGIGAAGIGIARFAGAIDLYVVDGIVSFLAGTTQFLGMTMRQLQTGKVQTYLIYVVIGVMVLFFAFR